MVGYSIAGHVVALIVILFAPRVMPHAPLPPTILTGEIVSLPPPAGAPQAPPAARPAAPSPSPAPVEKPKPKETIKEPPPPPRKIREIVPPEPGKPKAPKVDETKRPRPGTEESAPAKPQAETPKPAAPASPIPEGVGFATPGGETGGIPSINSAAFPYDWYRTTIVNLIRSRWRRPLTPGLTQPLRCAVSFVISRDGGVSGVTIASPSGFDTLDQSALQAVTDSNPLPKLPYQYTSDSIRGDLIFELTPD
jgi:TonB family protein